MANKYHKADYDYANSEVRTSRGGHLNSVNPDTGAFLKREGHPSFAEGVEGEREQGNIVGTIRKKKISIKTKRKGFLK